MAGFKSLETKPEVEKLASLYMKGLDIPTRAKMDAYHLAIATTHQVVYLVSWNCTHIASGRVRRIVQELNEEYGMETPIICTPQELMEV